MQTMYMVLLSPSTVQSSFSIIGFHILSLLETYIIEIRMPILVRVDNMCDHD